MKQSAIDWDEVRKKLHASEHGLSEALGESPARVEAAFLKRAAQLANGTERVERPATVAAMIFTLGQELYAIELNQLAEVLPLVRPTPVPGAEPAFLGVINVRGELRSVIDLTRLILGVERTTEASGFVLILRRPGCAVGIKVDGVHGLREISAAGIGSSDKLKYTKSVTGEVLQLIDIEKVLEPVFPKEKLLIT